MKCVSIDGYCLLLSGGDIGHSKSPEQGFIHSKYILDFDMNEKVAYVEDLLHADSLCLEI